MKFVRFLVLALMTLTPAAVLFTYVGTDDIGDRLQSAPAAPSDMDEAAPTDAALEAAFDTYAATYQSELAGYRQALLARWGEVKESTATTWVSYDESGEVRRSVDYQSGQVQVEVIVSNSISADKVFGRLDAAVQDLMDATAQSAYEADVVATRVERRLSALGDLLQTGKPGTQRLFSPDDVVALDINFSGLVHASDKAPNVASTDIRPSAKDGKYIIRTSFGIPHTLHERAMQYAQTVAAAAEKERITDELIYAIIETESSFNPMAKSHIPAFGLMQIVPRTAGRDATRYLYGKPKVLAPSYLYNPKNNIAIGAAYLHVLHYRYMRRVKNEQSRMYCAIAAYNTGATNVARAFIDQASFNQAIPEINKLSPRQVYDKLRQFLPQEETRAYIEKVSRRMEKYSGLSSL